jgi:hypothetical protein
MGAVDIALGDTLTNFSRFLYVVHRVHFLNVLCTDIGYEARHARALRRSRPSAARPAALSSPTHRSSAWDPVTCTFGISVCSGHSGMAS